MPIERKVMLSILTIIILTFGTYLLYNNYYLVYKDNLSKIEKYTTLITKTKNSEENSVSTVDIEELEHRIDELNNYFFDQHSIVITTVTTDILSRLKSHTISVSGFQEGMNSVRFTIKGDINDLTRFFYSLSLEKKFYDFPSISISMIDNNNFQGSIDVKRVLLTDKPVNKYITESFKRIKFSSAYIDSSRIMGTSFITQEEVVEKEPEVIEDRKLVKTNKFQFVGTLRQNKKEITMFRESSNGRIFKFLFEEEIDGWKYLGLKIVTICLKRKISYMRLNSDKNL
ncbi:hypothetical protein EW093_05670 [Thiospirochaeta perfilievii]|uniref:Uncharacterized protein n=1 Tax=Thiospirochaeta perfilievii TaxID=252967 RepID=A0A5C1QC16_9SPIO|nr:hypothetical protein [Thiospirochaeta perfilievii]QEN04214.1 hypothetical protein EW093_05670 [Thiospirochaeta perfilievii]